MAKPVPIPESKPVAEPVVPGRQADDAGSVPQVGDRVKFLKGRDILTLNGVANPKKA